MTNPETEARSVADLLFCLAGPTIWAAHLFVMYGTGTLVCKGAAADIANTRFAFIATAATLTAFAGLIYVIVRSLIGSRSRGQERGGAAAVSFLPNLTVALAVLALFGTAWMVLPAIVLTPCGSFAGY